MHLHIADSCLIGAMSKVTLHGQYTGKVGSEADVPLAGDRIDV